MIETLAVALNQSPGVAAPSAAPSPSDISSFQNMLENPGTTQNAIKDFVVSAENRVERGQLAVSSKLKEFDMKDSVLSLVTAMHESTMNSVSVQLTSKIGSKVSESFEQLIKQQ